MRFIGDLMVLLLAIFIAGVTSAHKARRAERRRLFRQYGATSGPELRRAAHEASILRSVGGRLPHSDPAHAARVRKARYHR